MSGTRNREWPALAPVYAAIAALGVLLTFSVPPLGDLVTAGSAGAPIGLPPADPEPTFTFSPATGAKPGRVLAVSGTNCVLGGQPMEQAFVRLARNVAVSGGEPIDAFALYTVGADGTWSGEFIVPVTFRPGVYLLRSGCVASDMVRDGPSVDDYPVLDRLPAAVEASRDRGDPSVVRVAASNCTFEDGSAAVSATFTAATAGGVSATADAAVAPDGTATATLRLPASGPSTVTVEARCSGPAGAMVAVPAVVPGIAPPPPGDVAPRPVARTG